MALHLIAHVNFARLCVWIYGDACIMAHRGAIVSRSGKRVKHIGKHVGGLKLPPRAD